MIQQKIELLFFIEKNNFENFEKYFFVIENFEKSILKKMILKKFGFEKNQNFGLDFWILKKYFFENVEKYFPDFSLL